MLGEAEITTATLPGFSIRELILKYPGKGKSLNVNQDHKRGKIQKNKDKKVIDRIDSQIERIIKEVKKGNDYLVNKYSFQLIEYNLEYSKKSEVCKTLCKIASHLMELHRFDLAAEYIESALLLDVPDAVPHNIKAEIFKARGDYEQGLITCEQIIEKFPTNRVVKSAKLTILLLMGKLKESDFSIVNKIPVTSDDFIDYHILGMYYLKQNNLDKALEIFKYGFENVKNHEDRKYFVSALCVARIRQKEFQTAKEILWKNEKELKFSQFNQLLLLHTSAETHDIQAAEQIVRSLNTSEYHLDTLKKSLISRYALKCEYKSPFESNIETLDQIIAREEEYLLAA